MKHAAGGHTVDAHLREGGEVSRPGRPPGRPRTRNRPAEVAIILGLLTLRRARLIGYPGEVRDTADLDDIEAECLQSRQQPIAPRR